MKARYYERSKLDIRHLKNFTKNTMFKIPINKRKKELGKITYKGYSKELYTMDNRFVSVVNLYFVVQGKEYKSKSGGRKRANYMQILQIPYKKIYKGKFETIYDDVSVKIFSEDPSFKYYLAYALNQAKAVIINEYTQKHLGIALTKKPILRNKKLHKEFNKHFYKLVEFISTKKMSKYLDKRYFLGVNKMPNN